MTTALGNLTNIYQATSSKEYTEALKEVKKILANVDNLLFWVTFTGGITTFYYLF